MAVVVRGALLGLLWWVLTEGDSPGWYYGVVSGAAALVLSLRLSPPTAPGGHYVSRAGNTVRLLLWFLVHSVLGGIDVSRRILARRVDVVPEVQRHPLRLEPGHQRQVALAMVSLMPGTLMVSMEENTALIHVLDSRIRVAENWDALQRRIAAAAGAPLLGGGSDRQDGSEEPPAAPRGGTP
ncbi:Na+/H+ antiporter subunit E [Kocuria nitroreducens]|uniref:Na+/H+ antiporter subunit E n=1 Tax=Kocuria nitroreducens TaxID=3058914 RepID=UPI0036D76083